MSVDDGDGGYGFARQGKLVRRKIGRRSAVPPSSAESPHAYLSAYASGSAQTSPWVWLLIGLLLGTGGTLLTASFWLADGAGANVAALEPDDRPPTAEDRTADDIGLDQPALEMPGRGTSFRTETDETSAQADQMHADINDVLEALPDPADRSGTTSEPAVADAASDDGVETEGAHAPDGVAATGRRPTTAPSSDILNPSTPVDPAEALATLVSETTEPSEIAVAARDGRPLESPASVDRAATPSDETPEPAPRPELASGDDATRQEPADAGLAVATEGVDADASRAKLPPQIREALLTAGNEPPSARQATGKQNSRLYRVQLAAVDDEAAARVYWREINERLPGVFTDVEPIFDQRLVDERLYLRIWVGAFDNRGDANGYCGWLKQQGQDCFVTRVGNL